MGNPLLEAGASSTNKHRVAFRHEGRLLEPIAGQFVMDFTAREKVVTSTPIPTPEPGAQENEAAVWFARGIALEEDPATQTAALAAYQKVLEFESGHAAAHINLGTLYYNRQDFNLAEKHYRAALEADPRYALAYFADKRADASGGDLSTASGALNRALRLHPNSAQALHSLGFLHMWSGDTERAIDYFVRAIRISPRDQEMGYMLHGLGTSYLMCGRNTDALEAGLRAVEEMPKHGPSHRVLIVALVRLGRMEEARAATARLLKIVPESRLANVKPPSRIPGFAERVLSDLRLAGYPE